MNNDHIFYLRELKNDEKNYGYLQKQINDIIVWWPKPTSTEPDGNLVFKNVWLGNKFLAHDYDFVTREKINHIINITDDTDNKFPFIDYTNLPIRDETACSYDLYSSMEKIVDSMHDSINNNKPILVHCKRGHHRSASVIALYLMKYYNMSLVDAIKFIKQKRPLAFRRMTCMVDTLIKYENKRYVKN